MWKLPFSSDKKIFRISLFTILLLTTIGCNKNKLKDEYASFIGTYEWHSTGIQTGSFLTIKTETLYQKNLNYTATIELNDKGEIVFYKDGSQLSRNSYRIKGKESNEYGGKEIIIKLKGGTGDMSITDNTLKLNLSGDSVLTVDKFPFPAIDKAENYKSGYSNLSSKFTRK